MTDKQVNELTMENISIKGNCKKQCGEKNHWKARYNVVCDSAMDYITKEKYIWRFADEICLNAKGLCYSTIKDYTNKKGITQKAHHTWFGKWCGSIKNLGDKPVIITCFIPVNSTNFTFDKTKEGMDRFIPIEPKE